MFVKIFLYVIQLFTTIRVRRYKQEYKRLSSIDENH